MSWDTLVSQIIDDSFNARRTQLVNVDSSDEAVSCPASDRPRPSEAALCVVSFFFLM